MTHSGGIFRRWTPACLLLLAGYASSGCAGIFGGKSADLDASRQTTLEGIDAMQRGDWQRAEQQFAAAVEACPEDERARSHFAEALWRRGERAAALAQMEQAVDCTGKDARLLTRLGEMRLAEGMHEQARLAADRAVAADRNLPESWALLGDIARAAGRREEALSHYHRALTLRAQYPQVQLAAAELYYEVNRPHRALATVQLLRQSLPTSEITPRQLFLEGLALKSLGRHESAVEALAEAARRESENPELLCHLADAQLLAGDPTNARLSARQALSLAPRHVEGLRLMAAIDDELRQLSSVRR